MVIDRKMEWLERRVLHSRHLARFSNDLAARDLHLGIASFYANRAASYLAEKDYKRSRAQAEPSSPR